MLFKLDWNKGSGFKLKAKIACRVGVMCGLIQVPQGATLDVSVAEALRGPWQGEPASCLSCLVGKLAGFKLGMSGNTLATRKKNGGGKRRARFKPGALQRHHPALRSVMCHANQHSS